MKDYIAKTYSNPSELQKYLNQWRHNYNLKILYVGEWELLKEVLVIIERTKKED